MTEDMKTSINSFILRDEAAKQMVEYAENLAKRIAVDISTSQIRQAYGAVKKLEMQTELDQQGYRNLLLLKPKLAYAKGRAETRKKESFRMLEDTLSMAIDAVDVKQPQTFRRFCHFFEAILAYHKANGGK